MTDRILICESCGKHPGTKKWVGEGGGLALIHGQYELWCEGCVLRAQIAHIEERESALGTLRQQLREWEKKHG